MKSPNIEKFSNIVRLIYRFALDGDAWSLALNALCHEFGADKAQLFYLDPTDVRISFSCGVGFDPSEYGIGASQVHRVLADDPVTSHVLNHPGKVISDSMVIDEKHLLQSSMMREVREPIGMRHAMVLASRISAEEWVWLGLARTCEMEPFAASDCETFQHYVAHIEEASRIQFAIASGSAAEAWNEAVFDELETGMVLLNDLFETVMMNRSAAAMINACSILKISNRRIYAVSPSENARLYGALGDAFSSTESPDGTARIALGFFRPTTTAR